MSTFLHSGLLNWGSLQKVWQAKALAKSPKSSGNSQDSYSYYLGKSATASQPVQLAMPTSICGYSWTL